MSKNPTNVYSELHPVWLDTVVPKEYEDEDLFKIILFFVFYSPCADQSHRRVPLTYYGWKEKPWYVKDYLKDPLDKIIFEDGERLFFASERKVFSFIIEGKDFDYDFYNHRDKQRIAITKSSNEAEYMSLFRHIRNALAHGRVAFYPAKNNDIMFVMEDGSIEKGKKNFEVTARMVLLKSTLLNLITHLKTPPQNNDYESDIIECIRNGKDRKKEIIKELEISDKDYKHTIDKLKINNRIEFINNKWYIKEKE